MVIRLPERDACEGYQSALWSEPAGGREGEGEVGDLRLIARASNIDRKHLHHEAEETYCKSDTSCCRHGRDGENGVHGSSILVSHD